MDDLTPEEAADFVRRWLPAAQRVALAKAEDEAALAECARLHRKLLSSVPHTLARLGPGDAGTARALISLIGWPGQHTHQQETRAALAQVRDHCARVGIDPGWVPRC